MKVEIHTNKGVMTADLFASETPKTVENFVKLAQEGFYEGIAFHRVIPDFVVQVGCPFARDLSDPRVGTGGPGYQIDCEVNAEKQFHDRGVLSMAHAGRNTGGSQFFICHGRDNVAHLDGNHTCFGQVTEGLDIIDKIQVGDKIEKLVVIES